MGKKRDWQKSKEKKITKQNATLNRKKSCLVNGVLRKCRTYESTFGNGSLGTLNLANDNASDNETECNVSRGCFSVCGSAWALSLVCVSESSLTSRNVDYHEPSQANTDDSILRDDNNVLIKHEAWSISQLWPGKLFFLLAKAFTSWVYELPQFMSTQLSKIRGLISR